MKEEDRKEFLKIWRKEASTGKACFNDITSISSYSRENELVEFGYNSLPQINLGLIVDSGCHLPLHYHVHDGDIHDVTTLKQVLKEGFAYNMKHLVFVMDKGFYSRQNIDAMYGFGYGFIIAMTLTPSLAKNAIDEVRPSIRHPKNIILTDNGEAVYAQTSKKHWWGDENKKRQCRFHVYTSDNEDAGKRGIRMDMKLAQCFAELNDGQFIHSHAHLYAKYFTENVDEMGRKTYSYKDGAIDAAESHYAGYLVLVTDQCELTSKQVLDLYRAKDAVEKAFFDLKNVEDAKRLNTHTRQTMNGKLFTLFVSSILLSELRHRMAGLKEQWTVDKVRRQLDKITFSKVKVSHNKSPKPLRGMISARQRLYLSKLLDCKLSEVEDLFFSIVIPS